MTVPSMIRGAVNMLVPAMVISAGVIVLVPLSPCLIFGVGQSSVAHSQVDMSICSRIRNC